MSFKRSLNEAQSKACEDALFAECRCRCGGALHGVSHALYARLEAQILEEKGEITEEDIEELLEYIQEKKEEGGHEE